ncbi:hypothetical protein [Vibrio salinus]|uniref:hypothetical protein n=1 Tax=Vibrio salinus TaxID=2899784 RepID=UPI001E2ADF14|nr:hypothetical protein [Vibrio salinus]MCE0496023.1 hypothetical protein [Vibrio salinus]
MVPPVSAETAHEHDAILGSISNDSYVYCSKYPDIVARSERSICSEYIYGINNHLNELWWKSKNKQELIHFLDELWVNQNESPILNNILIRLNLAFLMGQASWNSLECDNCDHLRNYVISYMSSNDAEILLSAITALGVVGKSEDALLLKPIILSEKEGLAKKAITAAVKILKHRKSVSEFMANVLPDIQRNSLRSYILQYK